MASVRLARRLRSAAAPDLGRRERRAVPVAGQGDQPDHPALDGQREDPDRVQVEGPHGLLGLVGAQHPQRVAERVDVLHERLAAVQGLEGAAGLAAPRSRCAANTPVSVALRGVVVPPVDVDQLAVVADQADHRPVREHRDDQAGEAAHGVLGLERPGEQVAGPGDEPHQRALDLGELGRLVAVRGVVGRTHEAYGGPVGREQGTAPGREPPLPVRMQDPVLARVLPARRERRLHRRDDPRPVLGVDPLDERAGRLGGVLEVAREAEHREHLAVGGHIAPVDQVPVPAADAAGLQGQAELEAGDVPLVLGGDALELGRGGGRQLLQHPHVVVRPRPGLPVVDAERARDVPVAVGQRHPEVGPDRPRAHRGEGQHPVVAARVGHHQGPSTAGGHGAQGLLAEGGPVLHRAGAEPGATDDHLHVGQQRDLRRAGREQPRGQRAQPVEDGVAGAPGLQPAGGEEAVGVVEVDTAPVLHATRPPPSTADHGGPPRAPAAQVRRVRHDPAAPRRNREPVERAGRVSRAEGRDSNPRLTSLPATAFKAVPIGRSGTPPGGRTRRPRRAV